MTELAPNGCMECVAIRVFDALFCHSIEQGT